MEKLFDCILQQGQLDKLDCLPRRYIINEKYKCEVILHNVTQAKAVDWCTGPGLKMALDIEEKNHDLWPYFSASVFWINASED